MSRELRTSGPVKTRAVSSSGGPPRRVGRPPARPLVRERERAARGARDAGARRGWRAPRPSSAESRADAIARASPPMDEIVVADEEPEIGANAGSSRLLVRHEVLACGGDVEARPISVEASALARARARAVGAGGERDEHGDASGRAGARAGAARRTLDRPSCDGRDATADHRARRRSPLSGRRPPSRLWGRMHARVGRTRPRSSERGMPRARRRQRECS